MRRPVMLVMTIGSVVVAAASGIINYVIIESERKDKFKKDGKKFDL